MSSSRIEKIEIEPERPEGHPKQCLCCLCHVQQHDHWSVSQS